MVNLCGAPMPNIDVSTQNVIHIRYLGLCTVKGLQSYITSLVIVRHYHGKQVIVYKVSDVLEEVRSLEDFTKDTHKSHFELDSTLTDYKITGIEK